MLSKFDNSPTRSIFNRDIYVDRTTNIILWYVLIIILTILAALRFPLIVEYVRGELDEELIRRVGDQTLLNISLHISSILAILIYVIAIALYATIGSYIEKKFLSVSLHIYRMKFGIMFFTMFAVSIPLQLIPLITRSATIPRHAVTYIYVGLIVCIASYLFRKKSTRLRGWLTGFICAVIFGVVLCLY